MPAHFSTHTSGIAVHEQQRRSTLTGCRACTSQQDLVKLHCGHAVYCLTCSKAWFVKNNTCPDCGTAVPGTGDIVRAASSLDTAGEELGHFGAFWETVSHLANEQRRIPLDSEDYSAAQPYRGLLDNRSLIDGLVQGPLASGAPALQSQSKDTSQLALTDIDFPRQDRMLQKTEHALKQATPSVSEGCASTDDLTAEPEDNGQQPGLLDQKKLSTGYTSPATSLDNAVATPLPPSRVTTLASAGRSAISSGERNVHESDENVGRQIDGLNTLVERIMAEASSALADTTDEHSGQIEEDDVENLDHDDSSSPTTALVKLPESISTYFRLLGANDEVIESELQESKPGETELEDCEVEECELQEGKLQETELKETEPGRFQSDDGPLPLESESVRRATSDVTLLPEAMFEDSDFSIGFGEFNLEELSVPTSSSAQDQNQVPSGDKYDPKKYIPASWSREKVKLYQPKMIILQRKQ